MKKKHKQSESTLSEEDLTPTATVGEELAAPAPDEDDWDGPTREVAAEEVAALAMKSTGEHAAVADALADVGGEAAEAQAGAEGSESAGEAGGETGQAAEGGEGAPESPGTDPGRLENVIESLLFVSDRPLSIAELKRLTGERQAAKLTEALEGLRARREESGIQVIQVAGGWHLRSHVANVAWVSRLISGRPQRLSRAMLETLAIVAYRQPVTRPEIDEIRGVDCGPVLGTLLDRGLVRMIGKKEEVGRPILYGTTPEFLRTFSLRDLNEMPTLREFHELSEAHQEEVARVDAESPGAETAGDVTAVAAGPAARPAPPARRELDPEEDDELLGELERAAAAAAQATDKTPGGATAADEPAGGGD